MPTPTLFTLDGKPVQVTDTQAATQAVLAGQAAPKRGTKVGVVDPATGKVGEVDSADLHAVLQGDPSRGIQGATLASDAEYRKAQLDAKWGENETANKWRNGAAALGLGVARGATLGLSDAVITEGAKALLPGADARKVKEFVRDVKETHGWVSAGGEALGVVGATIATGGEAGLAKVGAGAEGLGARALARYAPAGLADAAGGFVERAVAGGVESSLGRGLGARVLARGAGGVTRGATEGALWGLGRSISEASLGDEKMTAEKVLANVKHDVFLFGALGGGIGTGVGLLESAASKLAPKLAQEADLQAIRVLNPTKGQLEKLNRGGVGTAGSEEAGRWVRTKLGMKPGETTEQVIERVVAYGEKLPERWATFAKKTGDERIIDVASLAERIKKEVVGPLDKIPGLEGSVKGVQDYVDSLVQKSEAAGGKIDFSTAHHWRVELDKKLNSAWAAMDPTQAQKGLKHVRSIFEDTIEQAVDRLGAKLEKLPVDANNKTALSQLMAEYKELKVDSGHFRNVKKMADKAVAGHLANRGFSLTDYGGSATGATVGALLHGPVGAAIGLGLGAVNKLARTRGNSTASWALGKLADLGTLKSFVDGTTLNVENGARAFVRGKPNVMKFRTLGGDDVSNAGRPKQETLDSRYSKVVGILASYSNDPEKLQNTLAANTKGMEETAPKTQQALMGTVTTGLQYLQTKLPPQNPGNPLQPGLSKPTISDADKATFLRYADGTWNPMSVVEDLNKGQVSKEKVEALKTVHPQLFKDVQVAILAELGKMTAEGKELPYQKRLQIGLVFELPADPSMEPKNIQQFQAGFAPPNAPQGGGQPGNPKNSPGRPVGANSAAGKLPSVFNTRLDRLASSPH